MAWKVKISDTAKKQLRKLDHNPKSHIQEYLRDRLAADEEPRLFGEPLRHNLYGFWKYPIGNYRVFAEIQDQEITVLVLRVGHRKINYGGH